MTNFFQPIFLKTNDNFGNAQFKYNIEQLAGLPRKTRFFFILTKFLVSTNATLIHKNKLFNSTHLYFLSQFNARKSDELINPVGVTILI